MTSSNRSDDARLRLEMEANDRRAQAAEAQKLIDRFVEQARRQGLAPVPLRATTYTGRSVKTNREGWYLNRAGSVAIGTDGRYYRLVVPASRLARFTGVGLSPEEPPLHVGTGGRDGEGGDLAWFLERLLREGQPHCDG